jgi:dihydroorotase-like cyclic amidohydrolase
MFGSIPLFLKHIKKDKPYVLVDRLSNITSNFFDINWGLKTGFDANLLIVDIDNFVSKANCINPDSISHGVKEVIINGSLIYSENKMTGIKNGRVFNWV